MATSAIREIYLTSAFCGDLIRDYLSPEHSIHSRPLVCLSSKHNANVSLMIKVETNIELAVVVRILSQVT